MNSDAIISDLEVALKHKKYEQVNQYINDFNPADFQIDQAEIIVNLLRANKCFPEMEKAANLFITTGIESVTLKRQLAQSLIEQNRINQALSILNTLDTETSDDSEQKDEILGLIGRSNKQIYINSGEIENLNKSLYSYKKGWDLKKGGYRWHGINLVALINRARNDGVTVDISDDPLIIAKEIVNEINQLDALSAWDFGTAMEACIALGDADAALKWAKGYIVHPKTDAFSLASSLRQLKEVWKFQNGEITDILEPVFEYQILQKKDGIISLSETTTVNDSSGFEAVYGPESYKHMEWLENLLKKGDSVARVRHKNTNEAFGTGFIVKGSDVNKEWGDKPVFITNAHVISDYALDNSALQPDSAVAEFTKLQDQPKVLLGKKLFHSEKTKLDTWICEIEVPDDASPLETTIYLPHVAKEGDRPQRILIIGHPKGGDLVVSLYNNDLISYEGDYVHYTSPTEGGSSGSPALTRDLDTFALHHKTVKEKKVNEGVLFKQIKHYAQA